MRGTKTGDLRPEVQRALEMVRTAEDICNLRDLDAVVMSNSIDCQWRSRDLFLWGREQIRSALTSLWRPQIERRLIAELWAADGDRMAIRFVSEFRDCGGVWFRAHGCEAWQLDSSGLIRRRFTNSNEHAIDEHERMLRWPAGTRPGEHPELSELGF